MVFLFFSYHTDARSNKLQIIVSVNIISRRTRTRNGQLYRCAVNEQALSSTTWVQQPSMVFGNAWIGIWITSSNFFSSVLLSLMLCIRATKITTKIHLRPTESARSNYSLTVVMPEDNILNLIIVSHNLHAIHERTLQGRYENTKQCRPHISSTK